MSIINPIPNNKKWGLKWYYFKMKNSKSLKYFTASLEKWFRKSGLNQSQAGARLEISQSTVTKLLRGEVGLSISQADNIAKCLNKTFAEMLKEGEELLGEKKAEDELTEYQKDAVDAFKTLLILGGDVAEEMAERAIIQAQRKQLITDSENRRLKKNLKSA